MRVKQVIFAAAAAVTSLVNAQQTAWGQCGGQGIIDSISLTETANTDKKCRMEWPYFMRLGLRMHIPEHLAQYVS